MDDQIWLTLILVKKYLKKTIHLFNKGKNLRDMTSVFDIVEIIKRLILNKKLYNHEILNIGNQEPVKTSEMLNILFKMFNKKTKVKNEKKIMSKYLKLILIQKNCENN